jgi:hypothetical protein
MTSSKAPLGDGALPEPMLGATGTTDTIARYDYTTMHHRSRCPRCDYPGPHRVSSGTPPHHQRMVCGQCGRWLPWLTKPRPVAQEGRHA